MTNRVISSVRESLRQSPKTTLTQRLAMPGSRPAGSRESEIVRFLDEVRQVSGVSHRVRVEAIPAALGSLVEGQRIRRAALWRTPLLERLQIGSLLRGLGVEILPANPCKREMVLFDLGVTEADYILPETGTLVLGSSIDKARTVSLLPRVHLAVVTPLMLRADLHQVFAEADNNQYLVFTTGPSRTADIELTVTLGVHGPEELHVWMVDA